MAAAATTGSDPAMEVEAEAPPPVVQGQQAGRGGENGEEDAALMMSKAPSMSMLNEKEVSQSCQFVGGEGGGGWLDVDSVDWLVD
jgi:hypothetical protein